MSDYKRGHRAECDLIRDPIDNYLEHKEEIEKVLAAFTPQNTHKQVNHNQILYMSYSYENEIYFLIHCLYNAKTELYDRILTDMRSKHDPTEAFIEGWNRSRSNWYSKKLYDKCVKCIELKTRGHFVHRHWKECVWKYEGLSAQGWINLYQQLIKENKYDSWILEYIEIGE